jgi:hypothetical protein
MVQIPSAGSPTLAQCDGREFLVLAIDHIAKLTMPKEERWISFWVTFPRNSRQAVAP